MSVSIHRYGSIPSQANSKTIVQICDDGIRDGGSCNCDNSGILLLLLTFFGLAEFNSYKSWVWVLICIGNNFVFLLFFGWYCYKVHELFNCTKMSKDCIGRGMGILAYILVILCYIVLIMYVGEHKNKNKQQPWNQPIKMWNEESVETIKRHMRLLNIAIALFVGFVVGCTIYFNIKTYSSADFQRLELIFMIGVYIWFSFCQMSIFIYISLIILKYYVEIEYMINSYPKSESLTNNKNTFNHEIIKFIKIYKKISKNWQKCWSKKLRAIIIIYLAAFGANIWSYSNAVLNHDHKWLYYVVPVVFSSLYLSPYVIVAIYDNCLTSLFKRFNNVIAEQVYDFANGNNDIDIFNDGNNDDDDDNKITTKTNCNDIFNDGDNDDDDDKDEDDDDSNDATSIATTDYDDHELYEDEDSNIGDNNSDYEIPPISPVAPSSPLTPIPSHTPITPDSKYPPLTMKSQSNKSSRSSRSKSVKFSSEVDSDAGDTPNLPKSSKSEKSKNADKNTDSRSRYKITTKTNCNDIFNDGNNDNDLLVLKILNNCTVFKHQINDNPISCTLICDNKISTFTTITVTNVVVRAVAYLWKIMA